MGRHRRDRRHRHAAAPAPLRAARGGRHRARDERPRGAAVTAVALLAVGTIGLTSAAARTSVPAPAGGSDRVATRSAALPAPAATERDATDERGRRTVATFQDAVLGAAAAAGRGVAPALSPTGSGPGGAVASPVPLSPELTRPQPSDSPATLRVRQRLAALLAQAEAAQQDYDAAAAGAQRAAQQAGAAAAAAAAADRLAARAAATVVDVAVNDYMNGADAVPSLLVLATATNPQQLLDALSLSQHLESAKADQARIAEDAAAAAAAARARAAAAAAQAALARRGAQAALLDARAAVSRAAALVTASHLSDVAALQADATSPHEAALAMKAQTIAIGAATEAQYAHATSDAAVIAVAAGALLQQAAGTTAPARVEPGLPAWRSAAHAVVDEQAVMGPAPDLGGHVPYPHKLDATYAPHALEPFTGSVVHDGWPNAGVGPHVPGTAKPRKADGVTVKPVIPPPTAARGRPVLRAQVAVDAALAQLGTVYVWDAAGPDTFDCSGLTLWAWAHAGVALGHFTGTQITQGVPVAANQLLPGDLIFFGAQPHHVGLYLGAGFMIDAPTTGEYVKIQRVSDDGDFSAAVRP